SASSSSEGETFSVTATAYTSDCEGCTGTTATGIDLNANPDKKVIAVDPDVIPLGTEVHVEGYGNAVAADRSEEHTSELQSRFDLPSLPTRRSSDLLHLLHLRAKHSP